jgi:hypothetical protein
MHTRASEVNTYPEIARLRCPRTSTDPDSSPLILISSNTAFIDSEASFCLSVFVSVLRCWEGIRGEDDNKRDYFL